MSQARCAGIGGLTAFRIAGPLALRQAALQPVLGEWFEIIVGATKASNQRIIIAYLRSNRDSRIYGVTAQVQMHHHLPASQVAQVRQGPFQSEESVLALARRAQPLATIDAYIPTIRRWH